MSAKLPKAYQPQEVEEKIYKKWEKSGYFNPDKLPNAKKRKPYSISMPPPNVTGDLHLGHATALTLEDIVIRFKRMRGFRTLWTPGTDHAGIATQIMVERMLFQAGIDRHQIGREKFLKHVWRWKKKYGDKITKQIRGLGASCDWSREHFTMDKDLTLAVKTAFVKLYNDGLIYRGKRIISWCPRCQTALSDLEVRHEEKKGKLWYIRYPLKNTEGEIVVATTRPETMLGDSAVAVHLEDKRFKDLVGKIVILPLVNREISVIADERVNPEFGTGAVKVTPGHDPLDFEIGKKNKLPIYSVIDQDGRMTQEAGRDFEGLKVREAREKVLGRLQEGRFLVKEEDHKHSVGHCDRCNKIIEPLISEQWFIKMKPLAEPAIKAVKEGKIKIIPHYYTKVYFNWLKDIHDWCISRQLWWGHQIPIFWCDECNKHFASIDKPKKCKHCKSTKVRQDPDTLDTWFSSALWTFSTLGWPKKTLDLKKYHPTSLMETGWDILFFWVTRMIMMSLYLLKEIPFKKVYLNGLVLDKDGRKMSKSKGTGVDPEVMIKKYGTDAIRLSLVLGTAAGQDFRISEAKIAGCRNFCNKLWNIARYILTKRKTPKLQIKSLSDKWIVSRTKRLIKEVTQNLEKLEFSVAIQKLYDFTWHEFADWYLEISKVENNSSVLTYVLENILKMLHPYLPFITEKIWEQLNPKTKTLMIEDWPKTNKKLINPRAEKDFAKLKNIITRIRNQRKAKKIAPQEIIKLKIKKEPLVGSYQEVIQRLTKTELIF